MATQHACRSASVSWPAHFGLRLLQPELHAHLAIHRGSNLEVLFCLLALADIRVQLAEAEVTVRDERTHAQLGRERELAPPGSSAPQEAQASARWVPQPRQNLAWVGLSCWQRGHFKL